MPKNKYRFNPETLNYDKIDLTIREKILRGFAFIFVSIAVAVVYYGIFSSFFDTPKEKKLRRENAQLMLQYDIMDKRMDDIASVLEDIQRRDDNIYRTIFEAEPIPRSIREAGFGGVNRYADLEGFDYSDIVINTAQRLEKLTKQIYIQSKSYDEVIDLALRKEEMLAAMPAIQPISNKDLTRTASGWGYRIHPIYKIKKFHYGMDFTAPLGAEIYATGDGIVDVINRSRRGYGNKVIIDHGFGYKTLYAHLHDFNVKEGQRVKRGDIIGYVGNTGLSTAPHLHYEVHLNNKPVNPINYYMNDLTPAEYDRMIEISMNSGQSFD
ncbi:MAG: M23 family metallopeptidase [Bacteroidales bacterium]